jgi:hypothetical protein
VIDIAFKLRKFILPMVLMLIGCGKNEPIGSIAVNDRNALTYEGRIALNQDESLYMVVSLKSSKTVGEGTYELNETFETLNDVRTLSFLKGTYSLEPDENGALFIHLHRSSLMETVKRVFTNPEDGKRYEENFRSYDLKLRQSDDLTTVRLINPSSKRIAPENQPVLIRRTSFPFTIEGYFTHMGDSSRFEEVNTLREWPVSKLGVYLQALQQYHQLADKKFERIYLKGVGYAVSHTNAKGEEQDALVFQKLIQMSSAPQAQ